MAEQNPLVEQLRSLNLELSTQNAKGLPVFSGNPKDFSKWVKEVEKYSYIVRADDQRIKLIVYSASAGPASDFIERYLNANPNATWQDLKAELRARFGEVIDQAQAVRLLRKVTQKNSETIQSFYERILELARDTFVNADLNQPAYAIQLIDIFTDGLRDNDIARHVIRQQPATLPNALTAAMNEQAMQKRFQTRNRSEEPMEIGNIKSFNRNDRKFSGNCFNCLKKGHKARHCRLRNNSLSRVPRYNTHSGPIFNKPQYHRQPHVPKPRAQSPQRPQAINTRRVRFNDPRRGQINQVDFHDTIETEENPCFDQANHLN